jgi:hypothetical protein
VRIQLKDALTGVPVQNIFSGANYTALGVVVVPDQNGNGIPEIGVLGQGVNTGQVRVQFKDALTRETIGNVFFDTAYIPRALAVVEDLNGNGFPELAVLGEEATTGVVRVEIRDASTGEEIRLVFFGATHAPRGLAVVEDQNGNGSPELAVLGEEPTTGQVRVQLKDALTGAWVRNIFFNANYAPRGLAVVEDQTGNGVAELAVIGERRATGQGRAELKDALTGVWARNVWFNRDYTPRALAVINVP